MRCPLTFEAVRFNSPVSFLQAVKELGVDFVQTCNNHCLDRGVLGLEQTIDNVEKIGFDHSGTYKTFEESNQIFIKEVGGIKFAIICCTYGTNSEGNGELLSQKELWKIDLFKKQNKKSRWEWNTDVDTVMIHTYEPDSVNRAAITNSVNIPYVERLKDKIKSAKELADVVIVMPHVGGQYNPVPGAYTRHTIDWITDCGCDLCVAGHPHVPLRMQFVNNVFTAYSLGNFHFYPGHAHFLQNVFSEYGLVLYSYWNKKTKQLDKITFSIVKNVVCDDGIARTYPIFDYYNTLSKREQEVLEMDNEAIINRVIGQSQHVEFQRENISYERK